MNTYILNPKTLAATAAAMLLLVACVASETRPDGAAAVRDKLAQLQADPQLASRAPLAIKEAETAVAAAEVPRERDEAEFSRHLVLMADRKVDIAWAQARARLAEDQRKSLAEQRETVRLDSRTREADNARSDAAEARMDANAARSAASSARTDASNARSEADSARMEASASQLQSEDLQRQMAEINAKATDRGLVVTLGDVLFASGASSLRGGTPSNLSKLAAFLNKYPDRTVMIEGHTDSKGNPGANIALSQRRADAVKAYLTAQGVSSARLTTVGKGADAPVADNASATGRQQNRRVEVIISNDVASAQ